MTRTALAERTAQPAIEGLHRVEAEIRSMQELVEEVPEAFQTLDPLIELCRSLDRAEREIRDALEGLEQSFLSVIEEATRQALQELAHSAASSLETLERSSKIESIAEIAAVLQQHLGQRVTAYLSGVKDPKMVGRWARGKAKPRELAELRLRAAYPAAELLADAYGPGTARAWFFGTNSRLGDEAPAYLLRHGEPPFRDLLPAARAFVEGELT